MDARQKAPRTGHEDTDMMGRESTTAGWHCRFQLSNTQDHPTLLSSVSRHSRVGTTKARTHGVWP